MKFGELLRILRERVPLVDCITNVVTVNDCANVLLAAGARPSMASHPCEIEEAASRASSLVCNLGALDKIDSMIAGGQSANRAGRPVVLDPVAVGNTAFRRSECERLLDAVRFTAIRGNASEIRSLVRRESAGCGVDAEFADAVTETTLPRAVSMARELARERRTIVVLSGKLDIVSDDERTVILRGGCATMAKISGSGCMLTCLIAAFCGAVPERPFEAVCAAVATMNAAGENAEARKIENGTGNATFRNDLIDAVFNLTEERLNEQETEIFEP